MAGLGRGGRLDDSPWYYWYGGGCSPSLGVLGLVTVTCRRCWVRTLSFLGIRGIGSARVLSLGLDKALTPTQEAFDLFRLLRLKMSSPVQCPSFIPILRARVTLIYLCSSLDFFLPPMAQCGITMNLPSISGPWAWSLDPWGLRPFPRGPPAQKYYQTLTLWSLAIVTRHLHGQCWRWGWGAGGGG